MLSSSSSSSSFNRLILLVLIHQLYSNSQESEYVSVVLFLWKTYLIVIDRSNLHTRMSAFALGMMSFRMGVGRGLEVGGRSRDRED